MKKKKIQAVKNAMSFTGENPAKNIRKNIYIINDDCDEELKTKLIDITYDNIGGVFDLNYEICSQSCDIISENEDDILKGTFDAYDNTSDFASVYTSKRLSYLNIYNQQDISDKMKEYNCDIQTACAIWYDDMVMQTVDILLAWIATE